MADTSSLEHMENIGSMTRMISALNARGHWKARYMESDEEYIPKALVIFVLLVHVEH